MVTFCKCDETTYIGKLAKWNETETILMCDNCGKWVAVNDTLREEKLGLAYRQERIDSIYSYCTCGPIPTKGPAMKKQTKHEQCDHNCGCLLHGVNNGGIF